MNKAQVLSLLKKNRNERGIAYWKKGGHGDGGLKSFGIGLTVLRKLAKQVGRDRVLGLLIDDPKQLTREQAEKQVEEFEGGMLAHVFSSCDATLASEQWEVIRGCAAPAFTARHFQAGTRPLSQPWRALKEGSTSRA